MTVCALCSWCLLNIQLIFQFLFAVIINSSLPLKVLHEVFGAWLWSFVPIEIKELYGSQEWMMAEEAWDAVRCSVGFRSWLCEGHSSSFVRMKIKRFVHNGIVMLELV